MPSPLSVHASTKRSALPAIFFYVVCICLFLAVLVATIANHTWMYKAFTYLTYYIILTLSAVWGISLIGLYQHRKTDPLLFVRRHLKGILASFLLASVVFVSVPHRLRTLSDETNILSVAKSMTFYKTVQNITEGRWYYGMFWPTPTSGVEKRPFLFPFLTSLLDTFLGYRLENAFVLNYLALWLMLFLLYLVIVNSLGSLYAIAGLILVVAQPMVSLTATSGGVEIVYFLFVVVGFLALRGFLNDPHPKTFLTLLMTLLMLTYARYESTVFLIVPIFILTVTRCIRASFLTQSWGCALAPIFVLPIIWQRMLLVFTPNDPNLHAGSWIKAFGIENIHHNLVQFLRYVFDPSGQLGYAGIISMAGLLAWALLTIRLLINKQPLNKNTWLLEICSIGSLLALFGVLMFYQGGIDEHPINGRFYIPILVPLSIAPVYALAAWFKQNKNVPAYLLVFSLSAFVFYHPVAIEDRLTNKVVIDREYAYVSHFLKKNGDKDILLICGRPGEFAVSNYGAISYSTANSQVEAILNQLHNHLFSNVFVVQSIAYSTYAPLEDNTLDPRYELETVDEHQIIGSYFFRISRIKIPTSNDQD